MSQAQVHPTAIVAEAACLAEDVIVHAYAVIGQAEIGAGTVIHPHVVIADGVTIGPNCEVFPGAFLGKEPKGAGATARVPQFSRTITIASNCSLGPHCVIYYDVTIDSNTLIGDGASVREQCRIGSRCIISRYVTVNYNSTLGDNVKVMDGTHLTGNMLVEDDVFISTLVSTVNDNKIRAGYGDHIVGPIVRQGAIVGGAATLMPGVEVGRGAMVAAGAVVTKSVASDTRVAGVPARPF
jgi:UDP-3-O-[3-hydroxymyristoyl] glucosamine N-acyltransferase